MIRLTLEYDAENGGIVKVSRQYDDSLFLKEGIGYLAGELMNMCQCDLRMSTHWLYETFGLFDTAFSCDDCPRGGETANASSSPSDP